MDSLRPPISPSLPPAPLEPPMDPAMGAMPMSPLGPEPAMIGAPGPTPGAPGMAPMAPPSPAPMPPPALEGDDQDADDLAPLYPRWMYTYKDGIKTLKVPAPPEEGFCRSAVNSDERRHQSLIRRFAHDTRVYRGLQESVFEGLDQTDIEPYQTAEPATQVDKIANMIHGIQHVIQWDYKTPAEEDHAQALENAAYHILEEADRHHRLGGNADLKWDFTWYRLVYGRIVFRILPDPSDPDFPWDIRLYDPATVFPVFGTKRGLSRVSCVYQETLDRVLQTYGDDPKVSKILSDKFRDEETNDVNLDYVGTLKEFWNEWYRWVEFDGITIMAPTAHELGRVPFRYIVGTGEAGSANAPDRGFLGLTKREVASGFYGGSTLEGQDLVFKGLSFFHHIGPVLRQEEMLFSVLMTSAKQALNPPVGVESPYDDLPEPISFRTGATNKLRAGEKFVPLLGGAKPTDVGPLMTALREQRVKNMLPDQLFGAMDGGGASGFAVESLIGAAKDRIQPILTDVELALSSLIEDCMWLYRDFGHLYVDHPEGRYHVPARGRAYQSLIKGNGPSRPDFNMAMQAIMQLGMGDPNAAAWNAGAFGEEVVPDGQDDECYIDRKLIMQLGTRPSVKLHAIQLQNLTVMANVASQLIERKIWSRSHAMDELNIKNPSQMWNQILSEDAQTNPKMLELVAFPQALWESGNISGFLAYMATVIMPILMQQQTAMLGAGTPAGAPGAPTGDPALSASTPSTTQGASQPMVGQGQQTLTGPGNGGSAM